MFPSLVDLFKLVWPYIKEFGFKDVDVKKVVSENKTLAYLTFCCFIVFICFLSAVDQANKRMEIAFEDKKILEENKQQILTLKEENVELRNQLTVNDASNVDISTRLQRLSEFKDGTTQ